MKRIKIPRWVWVAASIMFLVVIIPLISVEILCAQNASNEAAWWLHVASQPPVASSAASADWATLERYRDTTRLFRSPLGETRPLSGFRYLNGQVAINAVYTSCAPNFSEGMAWAFTQDGRGVYIRPDGEIAFEINAIGLDDFSNGLAQFRVSGPGGRTSDGFVNTNGHVVIAPRYRHAHSFVGNYTLVSEPHFATSFLEAFVDGTGIRIDSCFAYRRRIIDRSGSVVPPSKLSNP